MKTEQSRIKRRYSDKSKKKKKKSSQGHREKARQMASEVEMANSTTEWAQPPEYVARTR